MRLQGLRQVEFNACEVMVAGHDGFRVQVSVTRGHITHKDGKFSKESKCNWSGEANNKHGPPTTVPAQAQASGGRPTNGPTH